MVEDVRKKYCPKICKLLSTTLIFVFYYFLFCYSNITECKFTYIFFSNYYCDSVFPSVNIYLL